MAAHTAVYKPRNPQVTDYYRCVEGHLEAFVQVYKERFERIYGFFRPYVQNVIYRYLDCGDLRNGFARVKCKECNHEYLLAFSCKRRHFCPSCHQKRVVEFGQWLCANVLKKVPHRHFVFSIPKILRRYFLYDSRLLHELSRCAWESLKVFLQEATPERNPVPREPGQRGAPERGVQLPCGGGGPVATIEDIGKALKFGLGHPMGPFELQDFVGLDIGFAVMETLWENFKDRKWRPSLLLKKLVASGDLGRKTGKGWYDYTSGEKRMRTDINL